MPFFVAAGLEFLNLIWIFTVLPETLQTQSPFTLAESNPLASIRLLLATSARRSLLIIVCVVTLGSTAFSQLFVWLKYRFDWEAFEIGMLVMFVGIMAMLVLTLGIKVTHILPHHCQVIWGWPRPFRLRR